MVNSLRLRMIRESIFETEKSTYASVVSRLKPCNKCPVDTWENLITTQRCVTLKNRNIISIADVEWPEWGFLLIRGLWPSALNSPRESSAILGRLDHSLPLTKDFYSHSSFVRVVSNTIIDIYFEYIILCDLLSKFVCALLQKSKYLHNDNIEIKVKTKWN